VQPLLVSTTTEKQNNNKNQKKKKIRNKHKIGIHKMKENPIRKQGRYEQSLNKAHTQILNDHNGLEV
jgi:hypothetical protein